jgi:hypothetical protein
LQNPGLQLKSLLQPFNSVEDRLDENRMFVLVYDLQVGLLK